MQKCFKFYMHRVKFSYIKNESHLLFQDREGPKEKTYYSRMIGNVRTWTKESDIFQY